MNLMCFSTNVFFPPSLIMLTYHVLLVSSNLEQFLNLSLSLITLAEYTVVFYRMLLNLCFSNFSWRLDSDFFTPSQNTTKVIVYPFQGITAEGIQGLSVLIGVINFHQNIGVFGLFVFPPMYIVIVTAPTLYLRRLLRKDTFKCKYPAHQTFPLNLATNEDCSPKQFSLWWLPNGICQLSFMFPAPTREWAIPPRSSCSFQWEIQDLNAKLGVNVTTILQLIELIN